MDFEVGDRAVHACIHDSTDQKAAFVPRAAARRSRVPPRRGVKGGVCREGGCICALLIAAAAVRACLPAYESNLSGEEGGW